VIADICADLGIGSSHPLWKQVWDTVISENGSLARLVMVPLWRARAFVTQLGELSADALPPDWPLHAACGPPPAAATHPP
jgi:hypothetical protein